MNVPLLDLTRQYSSIEPQIKAVVEEVMKSQYFIMGPRVVDLEKKIAEYCGAKYACGCASGTDAILLSLMALGVGPGDEVVTTPFTFFATAGCISRLCAKPVFVDIDPSTYNINPDLIERAITSRTKAIIPVHLFGQCADMDPINAVAQKHGIPVIEDAAQAIGAKYKGKRAGTLGTIAAFSFFPSKNLGAFGDGGIITTDDQKLYDLVSILRVHGSKPKYFHKYIGINSRLDALQAAILLVKLPHLDKWNEGRRANAASYNKLLSGMSVGLPTEQGGLYHIYNQYTVRVPRRDECREYLKSKGVGTEIYYPVPLHLQECYASLGYGRGALPAAEKAADEVMSLPIFPELTAAERQHVATALAEFMAK